MKRFFDENPHIKPTTRRTWVSILRRLERRYPEKRVNEITSDDLRDFIIKDDAGRPRTVASGTMLNWRTCFCSFFSWCAYEGLVHSDPATPLARTVRIRNKPVRSHTWMTQDEIGTLLDACRADPDPLRGKRDAIAIGLGIFCGLRLSEIAKSRWGDLNLRAKTLSVLGKGGKLATLPVPPQLVEMLFEWQGLTAQGLGGPPPRECPVLAGFRTQAGVPFGTHGMVEPRWGRGISGAAIYLIVKERGDEIGIPQLAPHDLRRSYAGVLEDRGVDLRTISAVLRHSSIATTERYLADNPKKWQESVSSAMVGIGL
jgi:integrase